MGELVLEKAEPEHAESIWSIIQSSFAGPHFRYTATGQPGYVNYLTDVLTNENRDSKVLVIAKAEGKTAAFADVTRNADGPDFLTRIAVDPQFRRRGIAIRTMKQIQRDYGNTEGWELDVVRSNTGARLMYTKLGFGVISTTKWIGRLLLQTPAPQSVRNNINVTPKPNYERYGFTRTDFAGHYFSVAGSTVRCDSIEEFHDDEFLEQVQRIFPQVDRAFVVVRASDTRAESFPGTFEIAQSDRMSGTFS